MPMGLQEASTTWDIRIHLQFQGTARETEIPQSQEPLLPRRAETAKGSSNIFWSFTSTLCALDALSPRCSTLLWSRVSRRSQGLESASCQPARTRLKESADSGRSSPRQTETHTTPAKSKQHARKHIPNRHTKSTSTSGKEKGFALPGALNSYPRFLTGACYAYRSQMLLQSQIFHKEEPGILTNEA